MISCGLTSALDPWYIIATMGYRCKLHVPKNVNIVLMSLPNALIRTSYCLLCSNIMNREPYIAMIIVVLH